MGHIVNNTLLPWAWLMTWSSLPQAYGHTDLTRLAVALVPLKDRVSLLKQLGLWRVSTLSSLAAGPLEGECVILISRLGVYQYCRYIHLSHR